VAAEALCELFHYKAGLPCLVLRTSRFFLEEDDDKSARASFDDTNLKVNELLYRRGDIEDMVSAHLLALEKAAAIGFRRYIISSTSPFTRDDLRELRTSPDTAVKRHVPEFEAEYAQRGWKLPQSIDRVYVNELARSELGWRPRHDFRSAVHRLRAQEDFRSSLALAVGSKGYHSVAFSEGPYPI
jgi:UDP-glucose 4-epimerase